MNSGQFLHFKCVKSSEQSIKVILKSEKVIVFFKEITAVIQWRCVQFIKSDRKNIYNVTKDFYFKEVLLQHGFHKKYKQAAQMF